MLIRVFYVTANIMITKLQDHLTEKASENLRWVGECLWIEAYSTIESLFFASWSLLTTKSGRGTATSGRLEERENWNQSTCKIIPRNVVKRGKSSGWNFIRDKVLWNVVGGVYPFLWELVRKMIKCGVDGLFDLFESRNTNSCDSREEIKGELRTVYLDGSFWPCEIIHRFVDNKNWKRVVVQCLLVLLQI